MKYSEPLEVLKKLMKYSKNSHPLESQITKTPKL